MQVSVEKNSTFNHTVSISLEEDELEQARLLKFQEIGKTANIDGFRAGKAPIDIIKQRYFDLVQDEVIREKFEGTLVKVLEENNLRPVGAPDVENLSRGRGDGLKFTVNFDVFPDVKLQPFNEIKITVPVSTISDEDIELEIESVRKDFGKWQEVAEPCRDKTIINFTYVCRHEGEIIEDNSIEPMDLDLGDDSLFSGFKQHLLGLKAGDKKTFEVKFPEDYHSEKVKGKLVEVSLEVKAIKAFYPAELNEELYKKYLRRDSSCEYDDFLLKIKENIDIKVKEYINIIKRHKVELQLQKLYDFGFPETLIESHIATERKNISSVAHDAPIDKDSEEWKRAVKLVRTNLLLAQVVKDYNIKLNQVNLLAKLRQLFNGVSRAEDLQRLYYEDKEMRNNIEFLALIEQAMDFIVDQAIKEEQFMTYREILEYEAFAGVLK